MKTIVLSLFLVGVAYLVSSCEVYPAHEPLGESSKPPPKGEIRLIPRGISQNSGSKSGGNHDYAGLASQSSGPYSCVISTLLHEQSGPAYWNRAFWVEYPVEAVNQAGGKTIRKALILESGQAGTKAKNIGGENPVVRMAQCDLPDSELAHELLENELKKFGKGSWIEDFAANGPAKSASGRPASIDYWLDCAEWFVTMVCFIAYDNGEWYYNCVETDRRCIEWELDLNEPDYGGPAYPDGWPSAWPAEGCPDPTLLCLDGPGGHYQMPIEENPCLSADPPVYCSNPCTSTYADSLLMKPHVQMYLQNLWESSNPGQPESQRIEQGGFFLKNEYGFGFIPLPSQWISEAGPCKVRMKNFNMADLVHDLNAQGAIYYVHTHPYENGETQRFCGDRVRTYYSDLVREDDRLALQDLGVSGIVIDADKITFFDGNGNITYQTDACGYKL